MYGLGSFHLFSSTLRPYISKQYCLRLRAPSQRIARGYTYIYIYIYTYICGGLREPLFPTLAAGDLVQPCAQMGRHKPWVTLVRAPCIAQGSVDLVRALCSATLCVPCACLCATLCAHEGGMGGKKSNPGVCIGFKIGLCIKCFISLCAPLPVHKGHPTLCASLPLAPCPPLWKDSSVTVLLCCNITVLHCYCDTEGSSCISEVLPVSLPFEVVRSGCALPFPHNHCFTTI